MTTITDRHRWAFDSYVKAMQRVDEQRRIRDRDAQGTALAEVLWWAVAVIDKLKGNEHWESILDRPRVPPYTGTERDRVRGIRWARNRVGHQLVDAVVIKEGNFLPMALPPAGFQYCWRTVEQLPPADPGRDDFDGEAAYFVHLQGRPVGGTISNLRDLYRDAIVHGP